MIIIIIIKKMSTTLQMLLSCFTNVCHTHCFVTETLLCVKILTPISKTTNVITNTSNHRPVMQSPFLLKIFEIHDLNILEVNITINHRQFGLKKKKKAMQLMLAYF